MIRKKPVVKNITHVKQVGITTDQYYGEILSVSKDSKHQLIVGKFKKKTMYIHDRVKNSLVKELHLPADNTDLLKDVTWTPNGHIVYTTVADTSVGKFSSVVTMSQNGDIIALTNMTNAQLLSVSANNVTYLADKIKGVYQLSDGGLTWSFMFNVPKNINEDDSVSASKWSIVRALEVSADENFVHFWALLENGLELKRLQMHKIRSNDNAYEIVETVNITVTAQQFVNINFIEFDGLATILVSCYFSGYVYLFDAASGVFMRTVDSIAQIQGMMINNYPERMAIDRHSDGQVLLYVAHAHTAVSIYTVSYK